MLKKISKDEILKINRYFRAANYLSVGQIYLLENPLLKEKLQAKHIKEHLLGHWGTTPGLNFIYVHLNRIIKNQKLNLILLTGPGHGAPAVLANCFLDGSYSDFYPQVTNDEKGLRRFFKQFSFPGGVPSHTSSETPGSIHEGGELGYVLSHGFGAVFDNKDLIACCVVGDGEAETGPLSASWHSNKFLNPKRDGAVLPILHLNGYKISNPTVLARISRKELISLFQGYGYDPVIIEGSSPLVMHREMAFILDKSIQKIRKIQTSKDIKRPLWPMIILKTPKGWTGPKAYNGKKIEGSFRSHQVPLKEVKEDPKQLEVLEKWMRSYGPDELFDNKGKIFSSITRQAPKKGRRIADNPHANGGLLLKKLIVPDHKKYALPVEMPAHQRGEATRILGQFLRDVVKLNAKNNNFRVFGPDETSSNKLDALYQETKKVFLGQLLSTDENLSRDGRVMEILSEHICQGWLEGYLLTGRHGFFSCYEAFIHIVDSMFNQFAKWIKVSKQIAWRKPIASLNYLLTSHVWEQDHNGFSHQDPGFIDHMVNKKADIIRIYLPPDTNSLLCVANRCLQTKNFINLIIIGKQISFQYLSMEEAEEFVSKGLGIWKWASSENPDVVMVAAGDAATLEVFAAVDLLLKYFPTLKIRVVNIIDLMVLQPPKEHPHGLLDDEFNYYFTKDKPIIFAFHGYPWLIHRLTYRRCNHKNLHVRGYKEEGTVTTRFDMKVLNDLDRFNLALDVVDRIDLSLAQKDFFRKEIEKKLLFHKSYIKEFGDDIEEVKNWKWGYYQGL